MTRNIQVHKLAEYIEWDRLFTENGVPVDGVKPEQIHAVCQAIYDLLDENPPHNLTTNR